MEEWTVDLDLREFECQTQTKLKRPKAAKGEIEPRTTRGSSLFVLH
jgi:hypothetical protein